MIKAIQTKYKGYNFRSRLEARWAVFFDAMGIKWEYEPEGFDLGAVGWYLPDFRIESKGKKAWVEVKGGLSGYRDDDRACCINKYAGKEKTDEFAKRIKRRGGIMFLLGDVPEPEPELDEIKPLNTMFVSVGDENDASHIEGTKIKLESSIEIKGVNTTELTMRNPSVSDQIIASESSQNIAENEVMLFSILCGITKSDIKKMTLKDYKNLRRSYEKMSYHEEKPKSMWEYCAFTLHDSEEISPSFIYGDWHESCIPNGFKDEAYNPETKKHDIRWRTWWPEYAYTAARSARFEHGETPCP